MKQGNKSLKGIEKLHPIERQRFLKSLLVNEKDKEIIKKISEEIKKAELEEEHLQSLEEIPKEKDDNENNLDNIVKNLSDIEPVKENKTGIGQVYSQNQEEAYKVYSSYNPLKNEHEHLHVEITNSSSDKVTTGIGEENLSSNFGLNKLTNLYNKDKKKSHEHGH